MTWSDDWYKDKFINMTYLDSHLLVTTSILHLYFMLMLKRMLHIYIFTLKPFLKGGVCHTNIRYVLIINCHCIVKGHSLFLERIKNTSFIWSAVYSINLICLFLEEIAFWRLLYYTCELTTSETANLAYKGIRKSPVV